MHIRKKNLDKQERDRLQELESTIKKNLRAFYEVGRALSEIRDSRLYRETHKTFEKYCQDRWDMKKAHAYRMIEAASVQENLSPIGDKLPISESQARPLTRLEPNQQAQAWQKAIKKAPDGKVTARHVQEAVNEMTGKAVQPQAQPKQRSESIIQKIIESSGEPQEEEVAMKYARKAVKQLKNIQPGHHDREEAFAFVQEWINKNR